MTPAANDRAARKRGLNELVRTPQPSGACLPPRSPRVRLYPRYTIEMEDWLWDTENIGLVWSDLFGEEKDAEARPRRARRGRSEDKRNAERVKSLRVGFVQENRADRWAVRSHRDWLMYSLYEHLFDLARFRGRDRGHALVFLWEVALDLDVDVATVSRKIRKLEDLGFVRFDRSKSDCFPNVLHILRYLPVSDSTDNTSTDGQNTSTTASERASERFTPPTRQQRESI